MKFDLVAPERACQELGERVRALRLTHSLSQQELARRVGCSLSSIRRLEASGQATLDLVVRIAQCLYAVEALERLFVSPTMSIEQLESQAQSSARKRAPRRKTTESATDPATDRPTDRATAQVAV
jgi:transcriptional regulator with XRE-family HTH domain